eukprot:gene8036-biopygen2624
MSRGGCSPPESSWNRGGIEAAEHQSCDDRVKTHSSAHLVEK